MKKQLGMAVTVLALATSLAACAETVPSTPISAPATQTASSSMQAADVELKTATSNAGQIVVDAQGKSVYHFAKDVKDSGTSACEGECLTMWPPVTTASESPTADGITAEIGTITTAAGTKQLTLNGLPLYHFANDAAPGDVLGQNVKEVWHLVDPAGEMVKSTPTG